MQMPTITAAEIKTPALVAKKTQTQTLKAIAEKRATELRQIQAFFNSPLELATEQTGETGGSRFRGLGELVKTERRERMCAIPRRARR